MNLNRLDKYIFTSSLKPFVMISLCVTAVIWLTQILGRVDFIVDDGGTLVAFLKLTVLIIPNLLLVIAPFAMLATSLYVFNRLQSDSEITVMFGAGAGRFRLARPMILMGLMATIITYVISVDTSPRSYRALADIVRDTRNDLAKSVVTSGEFLTRIPGMMVYAEEVRPGGQYLGLMIYDFRNRDQPATYMAESGLYRENELGPRLHLKTGTLQSSPPGSDKLDIVRFVETTLDMAPYQNTRSQVFRKEKERFIPELLNPPTGVGDIYAEDHYDRFIAEGHARLATPLYPLFYVLVAAVCMFHGGTNRGGYSRRIITAASIALGIRILGFMTQSLAADAGAVNLVQYLLPIGGIVICLYLLIDLNAQPMRKIGASQFSQNSMTTADEMEGAAS